MRRITMWLFAMLLLGTAGAASAQVYHPKTSQKLMQLTGDYDTALRRNTLSQSNTNAGVRATDLGSTFEHKGRLYFLFGDTVGGATNSEDCLAYTTGESAHEALLWFPVGGDGKFRPIDVPGITEGFMEVPSGGISYNDIMYIVQTTQFVEPNMEKSVMASSADDGATWSNLYTLSVAGAGSDMTNTHFINVSMSIVDSADWPGLPYTGKNLLIYGSGAYRASNVYLAAMPANSIDTQSTIRYLTGVTGGVPQWGTAESDAIALFNHPQVGEFSCYFIPQLTKWVMLYNAATPRGITMRTSDSPWGTFSAGKVILDPWVTEDEAYGRYMHVSSLWGFGFLDSIQDNIQVGLPVSNDDQWGGEYGPYLIPRWVTGDATKCQLVYTMSTFNPYQVVLMRSEVGVAEPAPLADSETVTYVPGGSGWEKTSGSWYSSLTYKGVPWISTNPAGVGNQGVMWHDLPNDTYNRLLSFEVHGGNAEVVLLGDYDYALPAMIPPIPLEGDFTDTYNKLKGGTYGEVLQCIWGRSSDTTDIPVEWDLTKFKGRSLKVVIIDHRTDAWGYVGVSQMTLKRNAPPTPKPEPAQHTKSIDKTWAKYE